MMVKVEVVALSSQLSTWATTVTMVTTRDQLPAYNRLLAELQQHYVYLFLNL